MHHLRAQRNPLVHRTLHGVIPSIQSVSQLHHSAQRPVEISPTLLDDDERRGEFRQEVSPHVRECDRRFPCLHRCLSRCACEQRDHQNQLDQKDHAEKIPEEADHGHLAGGESDLRGLCVDDQRLFTKACLSALSAHSEDRAIRAHQIR